jgi:uncharacterized protein (TIGR02391 family)
MAKVDPLSQAVLRHLCEVIGDTSTGLTGREIGRLLAEAGIDDPGEMTKRDRLYEALSARQRRDGVANAVLAFLQCVMAPARFLNSPDEEFETWRTDLNSALSFASLTISEQGKVRQISAPATTISEARKRASQFREELRQRGVHSAVLRACSDEIADNNYFHAVFETAKSLADRIRAETGLDADGVPLINKALGRGSGLPMLAFNRLEDHTDESEHDGYANMLRGIFGAFRNTTGHRPKISWPMAKPDALDMMTTASMLHRKLDEAVVVPEHLRAAA